MSTAPTPPRRTLLRPGPGRPSGSNETTKYIEYGTASNLTGPYTIIRTGDWAGWGSYREGPALVQLDNGGRRIFFDGYGSYHYSDSYDTFTTWTAPAKLPGISGTARHSAGGAPGARTASGRACLASELDPGRAALRARAPDLAGSS